MKEWVFLFPGQGSQYVGMGRDFYENYSEVRELFSHASDILQMDINGLCFEGPEDKLVLTENVQPAITVMNLACLTVLQLHEIYPVAAAGHSLGEYSALYAAGVLNLKDTLKLVRARGRCMQEAADKEPGSMAAIMNLEEDKIRDICQLCGAEVANINCAEQIIITGATETVHQAIAMSTEAGAKKCVQLNVSGAWHSSFMRLAMEQFAAVLSQVTFCNPQIPIINNVDARPLQAPAQVPEKLLNQLCGCVQWQQSMKWLLDAGHHYFVEVGPKKVLRGLMRRIDRGVQVLSVEDPTSLAGFLQANH